MKIIQNNKNNKNQNSRDHEKYTKKNESINFFLLSRKVSRNLSFPGPWRNVTYERLTMVKGHTGVAMESGLL